MRPLKETVNTQSIRREPKEHHLKLFPWAECSTHGPVLVTHFYLKVMNQSRFGVPLGFLLGSDWRVGPGPQVMALGNIWNLAPAPDSLPCLHPPEDRQNDSGRHRNSGGICECE